jgi:hypothetical protein
MRQRRSSKSRKLETEARDRRWNRNHRLWSWRVMARIVRWSMILFAMLVSILQVPSTAAVVEASTSAAARCVGRDTSAYSCFLLAQSLRPCAIHLPLEDTPAPISISGSSITIPPSSARPPVPPCSAVRAHLRSASVSLEMGITLMPLW